MISGRVCQVNGAFPPPARDKMQLFMSLWKRPWNPSNTKGLGSPPTIRSQSSGSYCRYALDWCGFQIQKPGAGVTRGSAGWVAVGPANWAGISRAGFALAGAVAAGGCEVFGAASVRVALGDVLMGTLQAESRRANEK